MMQKEHAMLMEMMGNATAQCVETVGSEHDTMLMELESVRMLLSKSVSIMHNNKLDNRAYHLQ